MDLKVYTRRSKKRRAHHHQQTFELPDEMVWEILVRLPVESLARFKSVSKAWLAIISDPCFVLAHLQCSKQRQHRNPYSSLLVTPQVLVEPAGPAGAFSFISIRFYRWSLQEEDDTRKGTATLVYARRFPVTEFRKVSSLAHCDGLMLLPTDNKAYVFNPATRDAIALPQSQHKHDVDCLPAGLGIDTSTGRYKVARSFYRSRSSDSEMAAMGMKVFTINGEEDSWRETLVDPPYPLLERQTTATHCKGYLFYFMDRENNNQQYYVPPPQGLLRFSLADETFGVTPLAPALYDMVEDEYADIYLNELHGELCATVFIEGLGLLGQVLIFMTSDVLKPEWDIRYGINLQDKFYPLALLGSDRILMRGGNEVIDYNLEDGFAHEDGIFDTDDIRYLGPNEDILGHAWKDVRCFEIATYTESLVPVTPKASLRRAL